MWLFRVKFSRYVRLIVVILFLISISICFTNGQIRKTFQISGTITDSLAQKVLTGASIYDRLTRMAVASDAAGFYKIYLPAGEHELIYSFIGFKPASRNITVNSDTIFNIPLVPEPIQVNTVVINSRSAEKQIKSPYTGSIELNRKDVSSLPSLLGESDFYKTIQLLPGIQSNGEGDAAMYVRGGGPDQNLIMLDGATVYNPTHLLGFYSVFNTDVIYGATMIKSGIPAEYGNRISSVVDFNTRNSVPDTVEVKGNLGLISSRLSLATSIFNNRGSIYIAGRRTYLNLLLNGFRSLRLINNSSILHNSGYDFYDLNAGIMLNFSAKDRIFLSTYMGQDIFELNSNVIDLHTNMDWGNRTVSLTWNHIFNDHFYIDNRLTYSGYEFNMNLIQNQYTFNLNSGISDFGYKGKFTLTPDNNAIRGGWEVIHHNITPNTSQALSDSTSLNLGSSSVYNSYELSAFLSDEIKLGEHLSIVVGLRSNIFYQLGPFDYYNKNLLGEISDTVSYRRGELIKTYNGIEPRISARYLISNEASIKFSYNFNNQYIHLINASSVAFPTDFWVPSSKYIKPQQGNQWTIGYYEVIRNLEISCELYYKSTTNQIEFKKGIFGSIYNTPIDEELIFGKGRAYGAEFLLRKSSGKLTGWIGYTIAKTERSFNDIENGQWFPAKYDHRHDGSLVANYDLNNKWSFSTVFVYASGSAYTPITGRYFIGGNVINQYGDYNSARMPAYNRLDVSASYTLKKTGKITSCLIFSIYNLYNRHNVFFIYPQTTGNLEKFTLSVQPKEVSIFPILPSVCWQVTFK